MAQTAVISLAVIFGVLALCFAFLAVWVDRPRGRMRCPKCRYDLKGLVAADAKPRDVPPRCPECGVQAKKIRELSRWRVRRRIGVLALLLAGMSGCLYWSLPDPWRKVLSITPSTVLIAAAPSLPIAECAQGTAFSEELNRRTLSEAQLVQLARVVQAFDESGDRQCTEWATTVLQARLVEQFGRRLPSQVYVRDAGSSQSLAGGMVLDGSALNLVEWCESRNIDPALASVITSPMSLKESKVLQCTKVRYIARLYDHESARFIVLEDLWKPRPRFAAPATQSPVMPLVTLAEERDGWIRSTALEMLAEGLKTADDSARQQILMQVRNLGVLAEPLLPEIQRIARRDPDREIQIIATEAEGYIKAEMAKRGSAGVSRGP